jgi:hypothetical protein
MFCAHFLSLKVHILHTLKLKIEVTCQHLFYGSYPMKWLVSYVTLDATCDLDDVVECLVATSGSLLSPANADSLALLLFVPVVLVAEFVELTIRKPITTTAALSH